MGPALSDEIMHAYVDGRLSDERRQVIERHLRNDPDLAATLLRWRRQSGALEAMFGPIAEEPLPLAFLHRGVPPQRLVRARPHAGTGYVVAFLFGVLVGFLLNYLLTH
jgi:anti-sigma factor RsiW